MIGIISDTHDNIPELIKALEIFKKEGIKDIIHLGDVVAPVTLQHFKGFNLKLIKGNCDGDIPAFNEWMEKIGGEYLGIFGALTLKNKYIALFHGKPPEKLNELIKSNQYDYVLHGHTHIKRDEKVGKTRIINPGTLYLGTKDHYMAILDLEKDKVKFIKLN